MHVYVCVCVCVCVCERERERERETERERERESSVVACTKVVLVQEIVGMKGILCITCTARLFYSAAE